MDGNDNAPRRVTAIVKWYNGTKGFGFVVAEGEPRDILLHANVLQKFGRSSIADGAEVVLTVQDTPRGAQAVEVLEIRPVKHGLVDISTGLLELVDSDLSELPLVPARVKWFDRSKGYGFANIWGQPADVFIHAEVLHRSGLADMPPGEAVGIRVIQGRRGPIAVEILSWNSAQENAVQWALMCGVQGWLRRHDAGE